MKCSLLRGPLGFVAAMYALAVVSTAAPAQVPSEMGYQGTLADAAGSPVADANYTLTFRLYDVEQGGVPLWTESHLVPVAGGVFSVVLGSVAPLSLSFDRPYWLGVTIDGGSELMPRRRLSASAYSLSARSVAPGGAVTSINGITDAVNVVAGPNVTVTQTANTLVVSSTGGGSGGGTGTGNTLDQAYDEGGAGAGRQITADAGAVHVTGTGGLRVDGRVLLGNNPADPQVPLEVYSADYYAVYGETNSSADAAAGVFGALNNPSAAGGSSGVIGVSLDQSALTNGVWGDHATVGIGVFGTSLDGFGVAGLAHGTTVENVGVYGESKATGVGWAGYMFGDLGVVGQIYSGSAAMMIDHPQHPLTETLVHPAVHSPDMMNVYDGNVTLNKNGAAVVALPGYFEALNTHFRYQLTAIGAPSPGLYVAEEIHNNQFRVAGGTPGARVSWMVTGVRNDAQAHALDHRVERRKRASQVGYYFNPAAYGKGKARSMIAAAHRPLLQRLRDGLRVSPRMRRIRSQSPAPAGGSD